MTKTTNVISIDLNDSRMKHISEIFGSESCKKILNLLAERELTETEISKELRMPLNSVDYNVKKLVQAGLIESGSHWWSVRGKKMPSYRVSDKKIIISPKRMSSSVLLVPALLIGGLITFGVKKISEAKVSSEDLLFSAKSGIENSVSTASSRVADSVMVSAPLVSQQVTERAGFFSAMPSWEWFLIGIWSGVLIFFLLNYILEKKR